MHHMGERIKMVRLSDRVHMTLDQFGGRIGLKRSACSNIENGNQNVTEQTILSICREFDVDETWLRTGEGEMFTKKTVDDEIAELIAGLPETPRGAFKRRLLSALAQLSEDQWELLADIATKLADNVDDDDESE